MQKLESENTFLAFIKKSKKTIILFFLLILGVAFLFFSSETPSLATDDEESKLEALCSEISGVGKCSVLINKKEGEVVSVAVLCEGGDNIYVQAGVKSFIKSLYAIGYNRVTVLKISE